MWPTGVSFPRPEKEQNALVSGGREGQTNRQQKLLLLGRSQREADLMVQLPHKEVNQAGWRKPRPCLPHLSADLSINLSIMYPCL